jgi:hypothetical protein
MDEDVSCEVEGFYIGFVCPEGGWSNKALRNLKRQVLRSRRKRYITKQIAKILIEDINNMMNIPKSKRGYK